MHNVHNYLKKQKKPLEKGLFNVHNYLVDIKYFFNLIYKNATYICYQNNLNLIPSLIFDIAFIRVLEYNVLYIRKRRVSWMEVMSAREAAVRWGISQRRVAVLCSENRIANAQFLGNMWLIPKSAQKPVDARRKEYRN